MKVKVNFEAGLNLIAIGFFGGLGFWLSVLFMYGLSLLGAWLP